MKVAVVYPYLAHYRAPIIERLTSDEQIDYYFLTGSVVGQQFPDLKLISIESSPKFIKLKNFWFFKYFLIQPDLVKNLIRGEYRAVVIFADWKYLSTWWAILYLKWKNIPVLFWTHGYRDEKRSINNLIKDIYFGLFEGGFVYDNRAKIIFKNKGYKSEVDVVYNSLDFVRQSIIYNEVSDNKEATDRFSKYKPYVVFSGRLTQTKRLEVLFDAISHLKSRSIGVNVVIIGNGKYKDKLVEYADAIGISNRVIFFGSCYDEHIISSCFIHAVACVIPSAVGLSAIHSLTYGCPVITDDNDRSHGPEIEAVVDNISGRYYKSGNPISLSESIEYFITITEEERIQFKLRSINIVESKFNSEYQASVFNKRIIAMQNTPNRNN